MAISEKDIKLLWGRAGGMCSKPDCRDELIDVGESDEAYLIGEMAHVIARNIGGPRSDGGGGDDTYDNLILLCPTHHRKIDKSPEGTFPVALLHSWKSQHERWVRERLSSRKYKNRNEIIATTFELLEQNRLLHQEFGPGSVNALENPSSSAATTWKLRKLDTIIPNNTRIVSAFLGGADMVGADLMDEFRVFQLHAQAFESNQYDRAHHYPLFPVAFARRIETERRMIEDGEAKRNWRTLFINFLVRALSK